MKIKTQKDLINFINHGNKATYLFFWGHRKPTSGVTKTCFSQWYDASFRIDGILYPTAEHYMMAEKARLFGDDEAAGKIITAKHPGEAKKRGRQVRGFDEKVWAAHRFEIVVAGNLAKFGQNGELKQFLLNTGSKILVEASPTDKIWGIGLAADTPAADNPNLWKGLNLLGFALMAVREQLKKKSKPEKC